MDIAAGLRYCAMLSKSRLTGLVVATTMSGYAMAPGVISPSTLALVTVGTALTSSAANSFNQFLEIPYDSQMTRTRNRVLVKGVISPLHAVTFGLVSGVAGIATLAAGVNPITACLGAANLMLYASIYTPMKRVSIANTWIGAVVGAIPPIMGWTACTGSIDTGALILGGILYCWQFPHFNALSWNLRGDYSRAGYRMMCVTDPGLCRRTSLRHSVLLSGLCFLSPVVGLTTWMFALDSLPLNLYMMYLCYRFYESADSQTSRKLFRYSLIYLPSLMILMFISKNRETIKPSTDEERVDVPKLKDKSDTSTVVVNTNKENQ
ncbi:protoheme IX farnesyltransferase, mitochondrial-like [Paramacrobiotus metropolitanus]|uniref:protoheme IX farnesyltransferase, mitochondrial-like n=1 Tax=Paramacrobiotus metropolitanus TaxID=2943436 RepID=UPI0024461C6E|nr:protoheme IX farnesyltransferase, mitochondrial-like [Paramacrobiotus metropolitanus]